MKKLIKLKIGLITYDFYKVINELKASNNNNKNLGNIFCNKICTSFLIMFAKIICLFQNNLF